MGVQKGSKTLTQFNLVLSREDNDLLRALHSAKEDELAESEPGARLSLSGFIMRLVRAEAKRKGVTATVGAVKGRKSAANRGK